MAVSYKKLFKLLIDKDMKKKDLLALADISYSTIRKLDNGENVNVDVLEKVCRALNCSFEDVMELIPNEPELEMKHDNQ